MVPQRVRHDWVTKNKNNAGKDAEKKESLYIVHGFIK